MNKLKNLNRLIVSVMAIFLLSLMISAQQKQSFGKASIKTNYGYLFISNTKEKSFTFEIRGKDVKPMTGGNNPMFTVDGKFFQVVIADTKNFVPDGKKLNEMEILELHKIWESDYLSEVYGKKLELIIEKVSVKDFTTMFWGFERPMPNQKIDRDYFLTKVVGKNVLVLSSSLNVGEKVSDYQKFLVEMMETLKISDEPFDITKLAEEIRKEASKSN